MLKIQVKLSKDPGDYSVNNPNKKIGLLLDSKAGDLIWYYKTEKGVSINPGEISVQKYKEMIVATVEDALGIMGYGSAEKIEIFGLVWRRKKKRD